MAAGCLAVSKADHALALTGIAGPGGGSEEKPVGLVCFGFADGTLTHARSVRFGDRGRDLVRELAAAHTQQWLRRHFVGVADSTTR